MDNNPIQRLTDSASLTDILIQIEDFIDNLDVYVFDNWFDGELISGPIVNRHWVEIQLLYEYKNMPHPDGGMRIVAHGGKVLYTLDHREVPVKITEPDDYRETRKGKPKMVHEKIWIITVKIPRSFIQDISDEDMDLYDENEGLDMQNLMIPTEETEEEND